MDAFHWIIVPISTVLGLMITRVLTNYVAVFKARHRLTVDWLPVAFAGAVLGEGLQLWWALLELSTTKNWSLATFTLLLTMVMLLFSSAALIAPSDTDADMMAAFERDGRWGLTALGCFHVLAVLANIWLWKEKLLSVSEALEGALAAISFYGGLTTRRRVQEIVAVVYVLLSVTDTFTASVSAY